MNKEILLVPGKLISTRNLIMSYYFLLCFLLRLFMSQSNLYIVIVQKCILTIRSLRVFYTIRILSCYIFPTMCGYPVKFSKYCMFPRENLLNVPVSLEEFFCKKAHLFYRRF